MLNYRQLFKNKVKHKNIIWNENTQVIIRIYDRLGDRY